MPVATPFTFFGSTSFTDPDAVMFTGFPFLLDKVDVSTYDFWTTLSGWSKVDEPVSVELKAQSINDSREKASKLFCNYNGHSVDFVSGYGRIYPEGMPKKATSENLSFGTENITIKVLQ